MSETFFPVTYTKPSGGPAKNGTINISSIRLNRSGHPIADFIPHGSDKNAQPGVLISELIMSTHIRAKLDALVKEKKKKTKSQHHKVVKKNNTPCRHQMVARK